jgi:hypothetical protein
VVEFEAFEHPDEVLIEDTAAGQSLIQELTVDTAINLRPIKVDGDKGARASAATIAAELGRVYLPRDEAWDEAFLDEVCSYPASPHDDWLDAFTQAVNYLRHNSGVRSFEAFMGVAYERDGELFTNENPLGTDEFGRPDPKARHFMLAVYNEETARLEKQHDEDLGRTGWALQGLRRTDQRGVRERRNRSAVSHAMLE